MIEYDNLEKANFVLRIDLLRVCHDVYIELPRLLNKAKIIETDFEHIIKMAIFENNFRFVGKFVFDVITYVKTNGNIDNIWPRIDEEVKKVINNWDDSLKRPCPFLVLENYFPKEYNREKYLVIYALGCIYNALNMKSENGLSIVIGKNSFLKIRP